MFDYVKDTEFLSRMRNLIVQNASLPIDLDYNLEIVRCEDFEDCRTIKESARKSFNKVLQEYSLGDCEDSTSSLTTGKIHFVKGNPTEFSMDVCIVCRDTEEDLYNARMSWK